MTGEIIKVSLAGLTREAPLPPDRWEGCYSTSTSLSLGTKTIFQGLDVGWCRLPYIK